MARVNRQWVLRQRPKGLIQPGDLELVEAPVPALNESQVLVRPSICRWIRPTAPG